MRPMTRLRTRLFVALLLAAVVPSGLLLLGGTLAFREAVLTTGTAGPWSQVAESGTELLDRIDRSPVDEELRLAAAEHREQLSESVRLSRIFTLVGERILFLLPAVAFAVLLVAALIALLVARRVSGSLSRPVRELVEWTEALGRGDPLPETVDLRGRTPRIREFQALRDALRRTESELRTARHRELQRERTRNWMEMARRVAHDLKNPLTPMSMAARSVSRSSDPAAAEAGEILTEEIERLNALARTFSQFGRPPEGPPSDVDLVELLRGLDRRLAPSRSEPGAIAVRLDLSGEDEVLVNGHPVALERAIRNLVVNASDASRESGTSEPVSVRLRAPVDGSAEIEILDRGPGLPDDAPARLWEPDFTTKRRGTGLGLPMVRQVVLAHGGRVEARNRDGGGAAFRIELPLANSQPEAPDP